MARIPALVILLAIAVLPALAQAADRTALASTYDKDIKPLLSTYCYKCHGPDKQKADINFSLYADGDAAMHVHKVWKLCLEKMEAQEMPPEKEAKRPSEIEVGRITGWIRAVKASEPPDAGRVTIHRLNRAEYNNTIRDLIGLDLKPAADFPEDDVGDGFDNIADVLAIPPLLMEKYLIAADQILDKATIIDSASFHVDAETWSIYEDGKEKEKPKAAEASDPKKPHAVHLETASEVHGVIAFPDTGKFTVKIRAWGEQAGSDPVDLGIKIDDKLVKEVKVTAQKGSPGTYTATIDAKRGMRPVAFSFINPFEEAPADAPKPAGAAAKQSAPAKPGAPAKPPKVRALDLEMVDIVGAPVYAVPESHKRIFIAHPDAKLNVHDAAKQILEHFASRAFRRPPTPDQVDRLLKVFDVASQQGEVFEAAVRLALKGVLISPSFLFRVEQDRMPEADGAYHLDDYEVASRLSYFLWSSMPDDELFEAARQGKLHDPADIEKQATRMTKDPKAHALVDNFFSQWLQLRKLNFIEPDVTRYPEFTKELRKAFFDEVDTYVENLMHEDRSILEFIDSDYAFVNDRLAKFYGLPPVTGSNLRKVTLTDHNRGGVLTMGGILAITSLPTRTSPVKRGKWVLEQLLGDPPPPPPAMVPPLDKQAEVQDGKKLSTRTRLERHRTDPVCASCHQLMDPIGFGLENFDAIGHWREMDGDGALDTSGKMPNGKEFRGPIELKAIFMANKDHFVRCLTEKMLTYAMGRGVEESDDATIDRIYKAVVSSEYKFSSLITQVVTSYPFLNRKATK